MCLDSPAKDENPITMYECHEQGGNQYFEYVAGSILRERYSIHYEEPNILFKVKRHDRNPTQVKASGIESCGNNFQ